MKTGKRLKAKRPVFHKGKKENPGNNMTVIVASQSLKKNIFLKFIFKHNKDKKAVACMRRQMAPLANLQTVLSGGE